ncbi:hypothetical protein ACNKHR_24545 [Shigella flexneri]
MKPKWRSCLRYVAIGSNPATGLVLEATGLQLPLGATCVIERQNGSETHEVESEVVGFNGQQLFLMPLEEVEGVLPRASLCQKHLAEGLQSGKRLPLRPALLGRVWTAAVSRSMACPPRYDGNRALITRHLTRCNVHRLNMCWTPACAQSMPYLPLGVGGVSDCCRSGVGKSVLLGIMARYTRADVIVVGLIGERGREVKDFIENILVRKACTLRGDCRSGGCSPLLRMQGAAYATRIAEDFRDRGQHVLLIMDSLPATRWPSVKLRWRWRTTATKGYPRRCLPNYRHWSSVPEMAFAAAMNFLVLPCSLKAMTSRTPLPTLRRAILDGHILLSPTGGEPGRSPAIDLKRQ